MVKLRNRYELKVMRESGRITAAALRKVLENLRVGVNGLELNQIAENEIQKRGGEPSFKTVKGYKWASCITINDQVVHGIPTERQIVNGDIVSIDLGAIYKGWHTDAAWTVLIREQGTGNREQSEKKKFLEVGEGALWLGIKQAVDGKRIGDISDAIQQKIEGVGYSVVRSLVGHGVGRQLHEEPEVPGYGKSGVGMELTAGMTLAIEVIYTAGGSDVVLGEDGWTVSSADGSLAGLFEMSVVVGKNKVEVLTDFRN